MGKTRGGNSRYQNRWSLGGGVCVRVYDFQRCLRSLPGMFGSLLQSDTLRQVHPDFVLQRHLQRQSFQLSPIRVSYFVLAQFQYCRCCEKSGFENGPGGQKWMEQLERRLWPTRWRVPFRSVQRNFKFTDSRSQDDLLAETSVACQFYYLLKNHTSFLKGGINEDRLKEILLIMVLISKTNIVDINKLSPDLKMETIGNAIYSFCNLFNHSCWPNVRKYFHGNTIVLRAINAIKKGEQCFVNYG